MAHKVREKAEQFSKELIHTEIELREQLKEITSLYEICRSLTPDLSLDTICQNIFKYLIPAMRYPGSTTVVIEIDGKRIASAHSNSSTTHELKSIIHVNSKPHGHLSVCYPKEKSFLMPDEQRFIDTIASYLATWLERKQIDQLLHERLKEITCLYEIRSGMEQELVVDKACQNIFKHLLPAMQFPEIATVVIELDGWRFTSGKCSPGIIEVPYTKSRISHKVRDYWRAERDPACTIQAEIIVNGKISGQLRVFYEGGNIPMMPEEQKLVSAIASDLGSWVEHKRLEQTLVSIAEQQQRAIGQELHDNLGQQIAAIGYQASALSKKCIAVGDESMTVVADSIAAQAQTAVIQVKQLAQGLLPFELETNGLVASLRALVSRISNIYTVSLDFLCANDLDINDTGKALDLYRIVQEAINNAIRHGGAKHITIFLAIEGKTLHLSIYDDGCGFVGSGTNHAAVEGGMGIRIMQYRAKRLEAKLQFISRTVGGTEVRLKMQMA